MQTSPNPGSIADVIGLENAAADEAHVTGLPLVHCQQYVRRNAALVAELGANAGGFPIPADVRALMDQYGWPESVARRHIESRKTIVRSSYRAPMCAVGSAA